jgi:hypothetical protein
LKLWKTSQAPVLQGVGGFSISRIEEDFFLKIRWENHGKANFGSSFPDKTEKAKKISKNFRSYGKFLFFKIGKTFKMS